MQSGEMRWVSGAIWQSHLSVSDPKSAAHSELNVRGKPPGTASAILSPPGVLRSSKYVPPGSNWGVVLACLPSPYHPFSGRLSGITEVSCSWEIAPFSNWNLFSSEISTSQTGWRWVSEAWRPPGSWVLGRKDAAAVLAGAQEGGWAWWSCAEKSVALHWVLRPHLPLKKKKGSYSHNLRTVSKHVLHYKWAAFPEEWSSWVHTQAWGFSFRFGFN